MNKDKGILKYNKMQREAYSSGTNDHLNHNKNEVYWDFFIRNKIKGKIGLDFACGKGRNIENLISHGNFKSIHGVDISESNIKHCKKRFEKSEVEVFVNNGLDLKGLDSDKYDYVMSTIALQHIPVHKIRLNLFREIHRVLRKGGVFRFQMGYGSKPKHKILQLFNKVKLSSYFENSTNAEGTNSLHDVRVHDYNDLKQDLLEIGFINFSKFISESFDDNQHPEWIWIEVEKSKN